MNNNNTLTYFTSNHNDDWEIVKLLKLINKTDIEVRKKEQYLNKISFTHSVKKVRKITNLLVCYVYIFIYMHNIHINTSYMA